MEEKIEVSVLGLSQTSAPHNTFALILKEVFGNRSIPIIIGVYEAQSIAIEIEGAAPPRPLTHDLIKNIIESSDLSITEVLIYDILEGTYFSKLVFEDDSIDVECRPSDAVAIGLRCGVPIYVTNNVFDAVGLITHIEGYNSNVHPDAYSSNKQGKTKLEQLQLQLDRAIRQEDYEAAAKIRDEIRLNTENENLEN